MTLHLPDWMPADDRALIQAAVDAVEKALDTLAAHDPSSPLHFVFGLRANPSAAVAQRYALNVMRCVVETVESSDVQPSMRIQRRVMADVLGQVTTWTHTLQAILTRPDLADWRQTVRTVLDYEPWWTPWRTERTGTAAAQRAVAAKYVSAKLVSERLKVSIDTVLRYIKTGKLANATKPGREWLIPDVSVQQLLMTNRYPAERQPARRRKSTGPKAAIRRKS